MARKYEAIRFGKRWTLVTNYGNLAGGAGSRSGWWCEDRNGGWGTSSKSAWHAVEACVQPVLYGTWREAFASVGADEPVRLLPPFRDGRIT